MVRQLKAEMAELARVEEERRALDEKLQRAKRMEDLGILAGGVAHDLNNILVGTVSCPDLLLDPSSRGQFFKRTLGDHQTIGSEGRHYRAGSPDAGTAGRGLAAGS